MCTNLPPSSTCATTLGQTAGALSTSSVSQLLRNNEPPSSAETRSARDMLVEAKRRLAAVETELAGVQNAQSQLWTERQMLKDSIMNLENILSPCRRLPAELLSEIFTFCLPPMVTPHSDTAPLLLTLVCRKWRAIALSTPRLWASICVGLTDDTGPTKVEQWLGRAGSLPLEITITCSPRPFSPYFEERLKLYVELAISYAHRWWSLSLPGFPIDLRLLRDPYGERSTSFPYLTYLGIDAPPIWIPQFKPVTLFRDSPSLRTLSYSGGAIDRDLDIPWAQLTSVNMSGGHSFDVFVLLFLRSPNMTSLKVEITSIDVWSSYDQVRPMKHSRLLHLTFEEHIGTGGDAWDNLFVQRSITFPALRSVRFVNTCVDAGRYAFFTWGYFLEFHERCRFKLQSLSLLRFTTSPNSYVACFRRFPSLVHVEFAEQYGGFDDSASGSEDSASSDSSEDTKYEKWTFTNPAVLTRLDRTVSYNSAHLLPKLRTVRLHNVALNRHRSELLAKMIASRMEPTIAGSTMPEAEADGARAYLEEVYIFSVRWIPDPQDSATEAAEPEEMDTDSELRALEPVPNWVPIIEPLRRLKDSGGFDIKISSGEDMDAATQIL